MRFRESTVRKATHPCCLATLLFAPTLFLSTENVSGGEPATGITVELEPERSDRGGVAFRVSIANVSPESRLLVLGSLANGEPLYDDIDVELISGDGKRYRILWAPPWRDCNCVSLIVPLSPQSTYSVVFALRDVVFVTSDDRGFDSLADLPSGSYVAAATLHSRRREGGPLSPYLSVAKNVWEGSAVSNRLFVELGQLLE